MPGGRLLRMVAVIRSRSWLALAVTVVLVTIVIWRFSRGQGIRLPIVSPRLGHALDRTPHGSQLLDGTEASCKALPAICVYGANGHLGCDRSRGPRYRSYVRCGAKEQSASIMTPFKQRGEYSCPTLIDHSPRYRFACFQLTHAWLHRQMRKRAKTIHSHEQVMGGNRGRWSQRTSRSRRHRRSRITRYTTRS